MWIYSGKYITKDSNLQKTVQFANKDEEKKFISDLNDSLFIPVKKQIGIFTSPKDSLHKDISLKKTSQEQLTGPVIKKLLPPGASPGAMIFILGENFTKDRSKLKVYFGDIEAKIIKNNEKSRAVEVPGSTTDCHIKVRVGDAESSGVAFKAGSSSGDVFITGGESLEFPVRM